MAQLTNYAEQMKKMVGGSDNYLYAGFPKQTADRLAVTFLANCSAGQIVPFEECEEIFAE